MEDDFLVCPDAWKEIENLLLVAQSSRRGPLGIDDEEKVQELTEALSLNQLPLWLRRNSDVQDNDSPFPLQKSLLDLLEPFTQNSQGLGQIRKDKVRQHITLPFSLLSVSYGMNGLIMHWQDLADFLNFLYEYMNALPVDLLVHEFLFPKFVDVQAPERWLMHLRPAFESNTILMEHIGRQSTFAERNKPNFFRSFPTCYKPRTPTPMFNVLSST